MSLRRKATVEEIFIGGTLTGGTLPEQPVDGNPAGGAQIWAATDRGGAVA
jgi:hypothetical protein